MDTDKIKDGKLKIPGGPDGVRKDMHGYQKKTIVKFVKWLNIQFLGLIYQKKRKLALYDQIK